VVSRASAWPQPAAARGRERLATPTSPTAGENQVFVDSTTAIQRDHRDVVRSGQPAGVAVTPDRPAGSTSPTTAARGGLGDDRASTVKQHDLGAGRAPNCFRGCSEPDRRQGLRQQRQHQASTCSTTAATTVTQRDPAGLESPPSHGAHAGRQVVFVAATGADTLQRSTRHSAVVPRSPGEARRAGHLPTAPSWRRWTSPQHRHPVRHGHRPTDRRHHDRRQPAGTGLNPGPAVRDQRRRHMCRAGHGAVTHTSRCRTGSCSAA